MLEYLASKVSLHPYKTMDTERCVYVVNDEILFSLLNKFLKDKVLNLFLDNVDLFGNNLDLSKIYFSFEEIAKDTIRLHVPSEIKEIIREYIHRDSINIKIDLL